ncbi:prostaglandin E synthase 3 isoform 3-T3 [Sylvia borin]
MKNRGIAKRPLRRGRKHMENPGAAAVLLCPMQVSCWISSPRASRAESRAPRCQGALINLLPWNSLGIASVTRNQLVEELCSTQPASAKWYDRRDYVFIEFCVEDSKDVNVNFEKSKLTFSCLGGSDNFKHLNEIDLFNNIDPNESKHKRTDRSILCCLRKGESGQAWPRLTKERAKLNWLSVDFNNWKDWEDDSDEDMSNFDRFSEMMNNMGGDDDVDLPEVDGADDVMSPGQANSLSFQWC